MHPQSFSRYCWIKSCAHFQTSNTLPNHLPEGWTYQEHINNIFSLTFCIIIVLNVNYSFICYLNFWGGFQGPESPAVFGIYGQFSTRMLGIKTTQKPAFCSVLPFRYPAHCRDRLLWIASRESNGTDNNLGLYPWNYVSTAPNLIFNSLLTWNGAEVLPSEW